MNVEDRLEQAYFEFDASRKGTGLYKGRPQAERDAFKGECRMLIAEANVEARIKFEEIVRDLKTPLTRQKIITAINKVML